MGMAKVARLKVLIDIPHPHFVHFYKNLIFYLGADGVIVTCQNIPIIISLLNGFGIRYICIGNKGLGIADKIFTQIRYGLAYLKLIRHHHIKTVIGTAPSLLFAALILHRKRVFFDDDDSAVQGLTLKVNIHLANYILTPACLSFENYGNKHLVYKGYQELAYLDPRYFHADPEILHKYKLAPYQYVILRFNSFRAYHDIGQHGLDRDSKHDIVSLLLASGLQVLISNELDADDDLAEYKIQIAPTDIHHVISFALLYIGDSQTMASEAAVLGIPSIRCNTFKNKIAYLNELEYKYNLTKSFFPSEKRGLIEYIAGLLKTPDLIEQWNIKRDKMLKDMDDVPRFMLSFLDDKNLR